VRRRRLTEAVLRRPILPFETAIATCAIAFRMAATLTGGIT
jgi:hypothetical protein